MSRGQPVVPRHWYNVTADHPELTAPQLDAATGRAVPSEEFAELFAPELVEQELDRDTRLVPIPEPVLEMYARWRPTPLVRARALEQALGTKCRIFYKYEGVSPIGSHKANSGVAQAYYAGRAGLRRIYAETGAGQWGSAISMGSAFYDLDCSVFMVGSSYDAKAARRVLMETFGSRVHRSPSELTATGRKERARDETASGSLGLAIAEAVEAARADPEGCYGIGSAFNFVCLHQTVVGQELRGQLEAEGLRPDALVSCIGGGSSFAGLVFPFLDLLETPRPPELVAVESNAVPKVTRGRFAYDHGDSAELTPLIRMYTLGHEFAAPGIHSGGLRYHGLAGQVSELIHQGMARAVSYSQSRIFEAAVLFARSEGLVPAPEAAHSIAAVCDLARTHRTEERNLVFCLTGHGFFDLSAYARYNAGEMEDSDSPDEAIAESLAKLRTAPSAGAGSGSGSGAFPTDDPFDAWRRWHFAERHDNGRSDSEPERSAPSDPLDLTANRVVTARMVQQACGAAAGTGDLLVAEGAVITPAARSEAAELGRAFIADRAGRAAPPTAGSGGRRR